MRATQHANRMACGCRYVTPCQQNPTILHRSGSRCSPARQARGPHVCTDVLNKCAADPQGGMELAMSHIGAIPQYLHCPINMRNPCALRGARHHGIPIRNLRRNQKWTSKKFRTTVVIKCASPTCGARNQRCPTSKGTRCKRNGRGQRFSRM